MVILFLDIDGVLNSKNWYVKRYSLLHRNWVHEIDPSSLEILKGFIERNDIKIVISSTWRFLLTIEELKEVFNKIDSTFPDVIIGATPKDYGDIRGDEVNKWLEDFKYTGEYLIIDDDSDFHPGQPLFQTSWETGIQLEHVHKMEEYLH